MMFTSLTISLRSIIPSRSMNLAASTRPLRNSRHCFTSPNLPLRTNANRLTAKRQIRIHVKMCSITRLLTSVNLSIRPNVPCDFVYDDTDPSTPRIAEHTYLPKSSSDTLNSAVTHLSFRMRTSLCSNGASSTARISQSQRT